MNPLYLCILIFYYLIYGITLIIIKILFSPSFRPVVLSAAESKIGIAVSGKEKKRTVNMSSADFKCTLLHIEDNNTTKRYMEVSICA